MRKIFVISLVLALYAGLMFAKAEDESDYVGTWIQEIDDEETGNYTMLVLHLTSDHQAYYCIQEYKPGEPSFGRVSAKTWKKTRNGIYIVLGENSSTEAVILADGRLGFSLGGNAYSPYVKIENAPGLESDDLPNGQKVQQGEYLVGEFIAPGNYRVTLIGNDMAVVWVYKKGRYVGDYYSLVYSKGETVANIRLAEGDTLQIEHSSVILSEMAGLQ